MVPGDVIASRFVIEHVAGSGGMGVVYRSLDRLSGETVALKVLHGGDAAEPLRFREEARALAGLAHAAIVRYVAHGTTEGGEPFLAMEWLEGEDLAQRLGRGRLGVAASVGLGRRAAAALGFAHACGIVHRDVKPSNLLLEAGDPLRVKVLDFGIARLAFRTQAMTRSGNAMGTAGYMAPEQARGERDVSPAADVFSLGCVLHECLTGKPAFAGEHPMAVLARVLMEEPPRVSAEVAVPAALDDLVARMLSKDRRARPPDGAAVARELEAFADLTADPSATLRAPEVLTGGEQRMLSVIALAEPGAPVDPDATLTPAQAAATAAPLREIVRRFGGEMLPLAAGATLVTLEGRGSATEQAARAASCALALAEAMPGARVTLATGAAELSGRFPMGPVIDRAVALLETERGPRSRSLETERDPLSADPDAGVRVDDATAGLLAGRFHIRGEPRARRLIAPRTGPEVEAVLLGRPTPFVGRERELTILELTFRECEAESVARAVLVTGAAGMGKSRLRREITARLSSEAGAEVLVARGDPVYAGSTFALAAQLVRHAARLADGDPPAAQHARLREHLAPLVAPDALGRVAEFLGEVARAPTSGIPSPQLEAARNDPRIAGEQMRTAFEEWLEGLGRRGPVVLVLEDLHWGDLPTVTLVDGALHRLAERPLFVLALARPEVHDALPRLWSAHAVQEIPLGALTRRAAERLVRAVLGDGAADATVSRILDRAGGNAFYLEELIRHVEERRGDELPDTVLAMVQSRLERLAPDARRVLRAASVFGEVFWEGGVRELVGGAPAMGPAGAPSASDVSEWLRALVAEEILDRGRGERFGERELAFRHGLLRDAAYAMLTEGDRVLGHRLAGEWLERAGESDALVLADHLERGGEPARAVPYLVRAAQAALGGGHPDAALEVAARGVRCGAAGEALGALRLVEALAHGWRTEGERFAERSTEALALLREGTAPWFTAAGALVLASSITGSPGRVAGLVQTLLGSSAPPDPTGPYAFAVYLLYAGLLTFGQRDLACSFRDRLEVAAAADPRDPAFRAWHRMVRAHGALYVDDDPGAALEDARAARAASDEAADPAGRACATWLLGAALLELGGLEEAEAAAADAVALSERARLTVMTRWSKRTLASVRLRRGRAAVAMKEHSELLRSANVMVTVIARKEIAWGHFLAGDLDAAEHEARCALDAASLVPFAQVMALAVLARIELARGRSADALATADRAAAIVSALGTHPSIASLLLLVRAEALLGLGERAAARDVVGAAEQRLRRIAGAIRSPALRASFLAMAENARVLELARSG